MLPRKHWRIFCCPGRPLSLLPALSHHHYHQHEKCKKTLPGANRAPSPPRATPLPTKQRAGCLGLETIIPTDNSNGTVS